MKLFKKSPAKDDGYATLVDNLEQTTLELKNTYTNLQNVVEPELIDYYIYQVNAAQMRHKFLLSKIKQIQE